MTNELERLVSLYDRSAINRRQLLQGLLLLAMRRQATQEDAAIPDAEHSLSVFQTRTINHVTLFTPNVPRSKAFYQTLTGLPVRDEGADFCEFRLDNGFLGVYE